MVDKFTPAHAFQNEFGGDEVGAHLDQTFVSIASILNATIDVLNLVVRADGRLASGSVHMQTLTSELKQFIQAQVDGWILKGEWVSGRPYKYGDVVENAGGSYGCVVQHTAGSSFTTDYEVLKYWQFLAEDVANSASVAYVDSELAAQLASITATLTSTYLSIANAASTYLTQTDAAIEYETVVHAADTYQEKGLYYSLSDVASIAPQLGDNDENVYYSISTLAQNLTVDAPLGVASDFQKLIIRIRDNGVSRAITWANVYAANSNIALPIQTTPNKTAVLGFMYNINIAKWSLVASA